MTTSPKADLRHIRDQILDAAEQLYAERGLGSVSLRQISSAAGARNTNAVQYHFGNEGGLIRALLERRADVLELQRAQLLAEYSVKGSLSPADLLAIIYSPLMRDEDGEVSKFTQFFLVLMAAPNGWEPILDVFFDRPVTRKILELLVAANAPVPVPLTWQRMMYSGVAMLTYVVNATRLNASPACYSAVVEDALSIGAAALTAPAGEQASVLAKSFKDYFVLRGVVSDAAS